MYAPPVLFVDDNVVSNLEICAYLRDFGFDVIETYRARDAFRVIDSQPRLTALVSDINLGAGGSGLDVARRARAAHPRLPVVFISGMTTIRHLTSRIEGSTLIAKPLHPQQIVDALCGAIGLEAA